MKSNSQHNSIISRKRKGIIITVVAHLLIVFCVLFGFKVVDPKPGDIEVTWEIQGIENAGGENKEIPTADNPQPDQENQESSASSEATDEEELVTDNTSDATIKSTEVKTKKTPKEVTLTKDPKDTKEDSEEEKELAKLKALAAAFNKGKINPGGIGKDTEPGIEGIKETDGTEDSGKKGSGNEYDISGRLATAIGHQNNGCGVSGTVKILITVNQEGSVINAIHVDGTTANQCLINQAKAFAKQIKYAPSSGGAKTNEGIITIKYSLS